MVFVAVASLLDTVSDIIDPQYGGRPRHRLGGKVCRGCPACCPPVCASGFPCYSCPMCLPPPPMCPRQFNQLCLGCPACASNYPSMGYTSNMAPLPLPPPLCPRPFDQPCYGCPACAPPSLLMGQLPSPPPLPQLTWSPSLPPRPASIVSRDGEWNGEPSIHTLSSRSVSIVSRGRSTTRRDMGSQSRHRDSPLQPLDEDFDGGETQVEETAKPIGTLGPHTKAQWTFEIPEHWRCSIKTTSRKTYQQGMCMSYQRDERPVRSLLNNNRTTGDMRDSLSHNIGLDVAEVETPTAVTLRWYQSQSFGKLADTKNLARRVDVSQTDNGTSVIFKIAVYDKDGSTTPDQETVVECINNEV